MALLFIHDTLPSQLFYILLALVLHAAMVFGWLPVAVRQMAQLTHQQVQVYIDRQRQRVVTVDSNTQRSRTYAFHTTTPTTSAAPSGLHLLGGAPQQPTAEHMQPYRTVCSHLQQVTGLVFV